MTAADYHLQRIINRKEQHTILIPLRSTAPFEINSNVSSRFQPTRRPDPFEL